MSPNTSNELRRALRRMELILDHLSTLDPQSVAEFRTLRDIAARLSGGEDQKYAKIRRSKDAIWAVLEDEGKPLFPKEIADRLFRGGFAMDPQVGPYLAAQNVVKHGQRGNLTIDAEGRHGLPEWSKK